MYTPITSLGAPEYAKRYFIKFTVFDNDYNEMYNYTYYANDDELYDCYPSLHADIQCNNDCCGGRAITRISAHRLVQVVITDTSKWDLQTDMPRNYAKAMIEPK